MNKFAILLLQCSNNYFQVEAEVSRKFTYTPEFKSIIEQCASAMQKINLHYDINDDYTELNVMRDMLTLMDGLLNFRNERYEGSNGYVVLNSLYDVVRDFYFEASEMLYGEED